MSVLNNFKEKQCLRILTFSKCNEKFIDQICLIYRPEEKNSNNQLVVANEVSVNVKTKNISKYDYFPVFLLYLKKA